MQYNHGQSGVAAEGPDSADTSTDTGSSSGSTGNNGNGNKGNKKSLLDSVADFFGLSASMDENAPSVDVASPDRDATSAAQPIVNAAVLPSATDNTPAGVFLNAAAENAAATNAELMQLATEVEAPAADTTEPAATEAPAVDTPAAESTAPDTGKEDAAIEGNGDGNGQVPPGQSEDENGNIVNGGGNMAPGLNRGDKIDKPENPTKPEKPTNPGTEDKDDSKANKANKGTHIYTYDNLNRMDTSNIAKVVTDYVYDTLGNLVLETVKNKSNDYEYNELNQLVKKTTTQNEIFEYSYDKRGNRVAEVGKKATQSYTYDATNRLVKGVNWKEDVSEYTYNGLGLRVNNLVTTHADKTYNRDYVIDYTSFENNDLYVYAEGNGQLEYEQRHVYAGSERIEQITEKGNGGWERTLYVHEDVMGNTRYYTKSTGYNFAELQYDAWGQPVSPNKLVNNDHGNYVFATFTGHIYDTTLDIYFGEARFYDANNRTWMASDPIKDGLNWYQYCGANPTTNWDPTGLSFFSAFTKLAGSAVSAVGNTVNKVTTAADKFAQDARDLADKASSAAGNWWEKNKTTVAKVAVGVAATAATVALSTVTGGLGMLVIGAGISALQSGITNYIDQKAAGNKVDWATVAKESFKGGVIGGISGGIGGAAASFVGPLKFCGQTATQVVGQVTKKWAVGTIGDGVTGVVTNYVSDRIDGQSAQQSAINTLNNMGNIWGQAALTSMISVAAESAVAPRCFVAGTLIATATGLVAIENIKAGDMVLSENPDTGEICYKQVEDTFQNESDTVVKVTINSETFTCTEQHPFYVEGKGWVNANALHAGMVVWLSDGTKAVIEDVSIEYLAAPVPVFNFRVADFHTYFIGESSVLVHNSQCGTTPVTPYEVSSYEDFKKNSVTGDQLEGHEIWQYANLNENGYASARATGEIGKQNIVIALPHNVHVAINRAQATIAARLQTPAENIAANIDILRNVLKDFPEAAAVDADALYKKVITFYNSVSSSPT